MKYEDCKTYRDMCAWRIALHSAHVLEWSSWKAAERKRKRDEKFRRLITPYTITDCKRELMKHHPDRGGNPQTATLWTERLREARKHKSNGG